MWRTMADGIPWRSKVDEELLPHEGEMTWTSLQMRKTMGWGGEEKSNQEFAVAHVPRPRLLADKYEER